MDESKRCIEDPAVIEKILARLNGKAPSVGAASTSREPSAATAGQTLRLNPEWPHLFAAPFFGGGGFSIGLRPRIGLQEVENWCVEGQLVAK